MVPPLEVGGQALPVGNPIPPADVVNNIRSVKATSSETPSTSMRRRDKERFCN
jgi:hypothetical protein